MANGSAKTVATWIGLGLTVIVVIVGASWNGRSYADDKAEKAGAASSADLKLHKAEQQRVDDKQDRKIDKLLDTIHAQTVAQEGQNVRLEAIIKRMDRRANHGR